MNQYSFILEVRKLSPISLNTVGALTSGLATYVGARNLWNNKEYQLLHIKESIKECKSIQQLKEVSDYYKLDTEDLWYYQKKYHMSLDECKSELIEQIDKLIKDNRLHRKISMGVTAAGIGGLALTGPKAYRSLRKGLDNIVNK